MAAGCRTFLALFLIGLHLRAGAAAASGDAAAGIIRRDVSAQSLDISEAGTMHTQRKSHNISVHTGGGILEQQRSKASSKTADWVKCEAGECKCTSENTVIRYMPLQDTSTGVVPGSNCQGVKSWDWVQHTPGDDAMNNPTPGSAFDRGFIFEAKHLPDVNLPVCGMAAGGRDTPCAEPLLAKELPEEPVHCTFEDPLKDNYADQYDSKPAEYCCSKSFGYCSYRCSSAEETFACPDFDPESSAGFPGGMDPCQGVAKACYSRELHPDDTYDTR